MSPGFCTGKRDIKNQNFLKGGTDCSGESFLRLLLLTDVPHSRVSHSFPYTAFTVPLSDAAFTGTSRGHFCISPFLINFRRHPLCNHFTVSFAISSLRFTIWAEGTKRREVGRGGGVRWKEDTGGGIRGKDNESFLLDFVSNKVLLL